MKLAVRQGVRFQLRTTGIAFASETVVRAAQEQLDTREIQG
jgi:hypothetical protein